MIDFVLKYCFSLSTQHPLSIDYLVSTSSTTDYRSIDEFEYDGLSMGQLHYPNP